MAPDILAGGQISHERHEPHELTRFHAGTPALRAKCLALFVTFVKFVVDVHPTALVARKGAF